QTNTDAWAKAGVMLRVDTGASAIYYAALVTPANGVAVQWRSVRGLSTKQIRLSGTVPSRLMVARSGSDYTAYTSSDGTTWTPVLGTTVNLGTSGSVLAGLAVTSHKASAIGTATFGNVSINTTAPPPPTACPISWTCADIGLPGMTGYQSLSDGSWTELGTAGEGRGGSAYCYAAPQTMAPAGSSDGPIGTQANADPSATAALIRCIR